MGVIIRTDNLRKVALPFWLTWIKSHVVPEMRHNNRKLLCVGDWLQNPYILVCFQSREARGAAFPTNPIPRVPQLLNGATQKHEDGIRLADIIRNFRRVCRSAQDRFEFLEYSLHMR